jgi:hypothetical protein
MRYTFGDAKRLLAGAAHAKLADVGQKINDALQALYGANGWEHEFLRQVVRISSASPVISLPQGSAGLVRACVNGQPVTMHGQDFQFLSSGPGDLERMPEGYRLLMGPEITDIGPSPVWRQPDGFGVLCAAYKGERPQPPVTVHAIGMDGDRFTFQLTPQSESAKPEWDESHPVRRIEGIALGEQTDDYITLFMTGVLPATQEVAIGRYHPLVRVPEFRRYRINVPFPGPYEVLAEVRVEPLPLVADDDIIPFPTLEPVKCMLLYEWNLQNNESAAAQKYLEQALGWLGRFNSTKNTVQTPVVSNVRMNLSMGEVSDWSMNL